MKAAKPKMGRPRLPDGTARTEVFAIKLSAEERAQIDATAERAGKHVTQWARDALIRATLEVAGCACPEDAAIDKCAAPLS
jgi:hypothetical protein